MNCSNCGAPLPKGSRICSYCDTVNDIDLKGFNKRVESSQESERVCPRCNIKMKSFRLKIGEGLRIEKCTECFGLFFDVDELEYLLKNSVDNVFSVKEGLMHEIVEPEYQQFPLKYIKCPVCHKFMNRINYGSRSGVIIDTCKEHGVWLDGGELKKILEWKKAGGEFIHQRSVNEQERIRLKAEREKIERMKSSVFADEGFSDFTIQGLGRGHSSGSLLADTLTSVIGNLF